MTPKLKHPSKRQAQKAAAALAELLPILEAQDKETAPQRLTTALELAQQAAQTDSGPQRSQLMGLALLHLSPKAAAELLAEREGQA